MLFTINASALAFVIVPTGRVVMAATRDVVNMTLEVNTSVNVAPNANTNTSIGLRIGSEAGFASFFLNGTIASVLRYPNVAHTAAQRDSVIGWLARRHAVTL